jgi:hypothetical protein
MGEVGSQRRRPGRPPSPDSLRQRKARARRENGRAVAELMMLIGSIGEGPRPSEILRAGARALQAEAHAGNARLPRCMDTETRPRGSDDHEDAPGADGRVRGRQRAADEGKPKA